MVSSIRTDIAAAPPLGATAGMGALASAFPEDGFSPPGFSLDCFEVADGFDLSPNLPVLDAAADNDKRPNIPVPDALTSLGALLMALPLPATRTPMPSAPLDLPGIGSAPAPNSTNMPVVLTNPASSRQSANAANDHPRLAAPVMEPGILPAIPQATPRPTTTASNSAADDDTDGASSPRPAETECTPVGTEPIAVTPLPVPVTRPATGSAAATYLPDRSRGPQSRAPARADHPTASAAPVRSAGFPASPVRQVASIPTHQTPRGTVADPVGAPMSPDPQVSLHSAPWAGEIAATATPSVTAAVPPQPAAAVGSGTVTPFPPPSHAPLAGVTIGESAVAIVQPSAHATAPVAVDTVVPGATSRPDMPITDGSVTDAPPVDATQIRRGSVDTGETATTLRMSEAPPTEARSSRAAPITSTDKIPVATRVAQITRDAQPAVLKTPAAAPGLPDALSNAAATGAVAADPSPAGGFSVGGPSGNHPSERLATAASHAAPHTALPRHNISHVTQLAAQFPDRQIEVILSPEELGAVRMTFANADGAMTMSIIADRPETLDLLRRNIDLLAQDFRDLGFSDVRFSFSAGTDHADGQRKSGAPHQPDLDENIMALLAAPSQLSPTHALAAARTGSGLDVRL